MSQSVKIVPEKVMRPFRDQDGIVYIRVSQKDAKNLYDDSHLLSRTISSKRVESAVEIADFTKICADENLHIAIRPDGIFYVFSSDDHAKFAHGEFIRQAYFRFKKL